MKQITYEEFDDLPNGARVKVVLSARGREYWKGVDLDQWIYVVDNGIFIKNTSDGNPDNNVQATAEEAGWRNGEWCEKWTLDPHDFNEIRSWVYLVGTAKCIYCGGVIEPYKNLGVCLECFRVQDEA